MKFILRLNHPMSRNNSDSNLRRSVNWSMERWSFSYSYASSIGCSSSLSFLECTYMSGSWFDCRYFV